MVECKRTASLGVGWGRAAGASGAPPPACVRGAAARRPRYMSLCGERAPRALVTDSQWRRRPTVCGTAAGGARCTAPLHSACPPAESVPHRSARPPRPEQFSASGGKNRLCTEPRIIWARRTAPLRPPSVGRAGQAHCLSLRAAPPPPVSSYYLKHYAVMNRGTYARNCDDSYRTYEINYFNKIIKLFMYLVPFSI